MTHAGIIEREQAIFNDCVERRIDPVWEISQDRLKRYSKYLSEYPPSEAVTAWAVEMSKKYGTQCRYWNNTVSWVTALLICRYGEAEYHWPATGELTEGDMSRAGELLKGQFPEELRIIG